MYKKVKLIKAITLFLFLGLHHVNAQKLNLQKISVKDGSSEKFSSGSHNAYTTTVYETSKDDVESKWKSFLKDFKNQIFC